MPAPVPRNRKPSTATHNHLITASIYDTNDWKFTFLNERNCCFSMS